MILAQGTDYDPDAEHRSFNAIAHQKLPPPPRTTIGS